MIKNLLILKKKLKNVLIKNSLREILIKVIHLYISFKLFILFVKNHDIENFTWIERVMVFLNSKIKKII